MRVFAFLDVLIAGINKNIAVFGLAAGTLLVFINVVLRYVFNSGLSWAAELSNYLFIWSAFFAAAYGFRQGIHISVTLLLEKFPPFWAKFFFICANLLTVIFLLALVYHSFYYLKVLDMIGQMCQDLPLPQWVPMLALPLSFTLAAYRAAEKAWQYSKMPDHLITKSASDELVKDAVSSLGMDEEELKAAMRLDESVTSGNKSGLASEEKAAKNGSCEDERSKS